MSLPTRLPVLFLTLIALAISALAADSILPTSASSTFPQCGLTCTVLTNAETSCEAADASTWTSCFCQSALLTGLKTSGSVCSTCSAADQTTLSTWYNNYCNSGGKDTTDTAATGTNSSPDAASTSGVTKSDSTTNTNKSASASASDENPSWWSSHWRWVIMLIVLVIGFSAIAVVGVWLKRRHDARRPNLYHGGSSSMLSASLPVPHDAAWGPGPVPVVQAHGLGSDSLASSSRSTMAKTSTPVPGARTRLTKIEQESADVEIRQV
ncbi:uncharacterized protein N7479_003833 [Penicillium vulpinum]|uniref:CFEM domain-containing protein n=1 Tax=Penicillium vulpinum TaxID=29845 RepID=A0A1V6RFF0_9EURO|nr:uncharacterized protein N7479_003833 [Penicillium vulpinum]KAJ5963957.1 hypothetical protein N7479_003833 [Penicillium vulpinum]OQE00512.1 hypothetical protein PENVUL_c050G05775 [Penicillium vulpinum]